MNEESQEALRKALPFLFLDQFSERELDLVSKPSKTSAVYILMEKFGWDAKSVSKLLNIKETTVWGYKARADKYVNGARN